MAPGIYSAVPPPPNLDPASTPLPYRPARTSTTPIDIEAWTVSALAALCVSPDARGIGSPLAIPLDEEPARAVKSPRRDATGALRTQRPPSARDTPSRREERRKGKEGSRQRRRWDNDRLIGVPNAQPPQPIDFLPRATHPVTNVPYRVAKYWDRDLRHHIEEKASALQAARKHRQRQDGRATGLGAGEMSRDLRESLKRTPVVRTWLRELEHPVRAFVSEQREMNADEGGKDGDEEMEDEVLFTGRKKESEAAEKEAERAAEREAGWKRARREMAGGRVEAGLVFEPPRDDEAAALKRWIAHAISDYYGLESKSTTVGNPGRRVVYLGLKTGRDQTPQWAPLPRPMWEVC
ncbi:uncharacterized protein DNG_02936 [Cephalotrichum gorgonifer]|uniref:R3H-associated N-terminal domain-containing protein n=1 Tax=Cephalotrichum gorgonifer TaxID=2041049 RepID=A0AAE8MTA9_9PEZI|nr:uncharacterized protein DNG_02936 [Cephalotrichum gorgonifer]